MSYFQTAFQSDTFIEINKVQAYGCCCWGVSLVSDSELHNHLNFVFQFNGPNSDDPIFTEFVFPIIVRCSKGIFFCKVKRSSI